MMKEKLVRSALMQTAHKEEVVCGKAFLRCAVNGEPQDYEVEIIKRSQEVLEDFRFALQIRYFLKKQAALFRV